MNHEPRQTPPSAPAASVEPGEAGAGAGAGAGAECMPKALVLPAALEQGIDGLIARYPQKRSAALMVLHALQEHFGHLSSESLEWAARRLELQPINLYELVTFYPMLRQKPMGRFHLKVCRTLSCALGGSHQLREHLCRQLRLDPDVHGPQTTDDGLFTVEFVECLASCGTPPAMMCNDRFFDLVTADKADAILAECRRTVG